jgi:hypothetical protein
VGLACPINQDLVAAHGYTILVQEGRDGFLGGEGYIVYGDPVRAKGLMEDDFVRLRLN